jgi:hypothetical protein
MNMRTAPPDDRQPDRNVTHDDPQPSTRDESGTTANLDEHAGDVPPRADIEQTDDPSKD